MIAESGPPQGGIIVKIAWIPNGGGGNESEWGLSMSRFIAIDPSTTWTGWAVFEDQGLVAWGHINTKGAPYADRFSFIIEELARACVQYGAREVVIEDVKFAWQSRTRNRNIAGLQVVFKSIQDWSKSIGLPITAHNPATWKNAVIGDSHASKDLTRASLLLRFQSLPSDLTEHEYDAVGIGVYHGGVRYLESLAKGGK